jgi:hypothetical protein
MPDRFASLAAEVGDLLPWVPVIQMLVLVPAQDRGPSWNRAFALLHGVAQQLLDHHSTGKSQPPSTAARQVVPAITNASAGHAPLMHVHTSTTSQPPGTAARHARQASSESPPSERHAEHEDRPKRARTSTAATARRPTGAPLRNRRRSARIGLGGGVLTATARIAPRSRVVRSTAPRVSHRTHSPVEDGARVDDAAHGDVGRAGARHTVARLSRITVRVC